MLAPVSYKSDLCKKSKGLIPRGLKNHAESLKISMWFFNPCVTLLVAACCVGGSSFPRFSFETYKWKSGFEKLA
jgi:hypothetical protein